MTGQVTGGERLDVEAGSEVSELNDTHEDMENDDDIKPVDNEEDSPVHVRSKAELRVNLCWCQCKNLICVLQLSGTKVENENQEICLI